MDGYYDHHPLLVLERHIALAGPVVDDTRKIGHRLASLLGLPFIDLDRRIEHRAGASIWTIARHEGADGLRRRESVALLHAIEDKPYGVLVLGDGALIARDNQLQVDLRTRLIVLDYTPRVAFSRLRAHADQRRELANDDSLAATSTTPRVPEVDPTASSSPAPRVRIPAPAEVTDWHPLATEPLETLQQVHPFVGERASGFAAGEHVAVAGQRLRGVVERLENKLVS